MIVASFWDLKHNEKHIALIEDSFSPVTYGEFKYKVETFKEQLPRLRKKQLGLILCSNRVATLTAYIAGLQLSDALLLLDEKINDKFLKNIIERYEPDWIYTSKSFQGHDDYRLHYKSNHYEIWCRASSIDTTEIYPDLALLLSTSGTTGSSKFVRLSYKNIQSNAEAIAAYLQLNETERAITTLPMQYSYGLSVINSHLLAGGTLLLTDDSILSKDFWSFFKKNKATSLAGVPYIYQMLHRLRFDRMDLPSLRYFTQAGGRLSPNLVRYFNEVAKEKGWRFYVMYGQTEATARISYVPPERLSEKESSIGIPIPNGKLSLDAETSELIYEGPNVMLGYAHSRSDLAKGDELFGRLHTGDIAAMDEDGYFYIKGRMRRFIKLFGLRLNLDEIEKQIEQHFSINVACVGDDNKLYVITEEAAKIDEIKLYIRDLYKLHPSAFTVKRIAAFPRLANGKINYTELKDLML